MGKAKPFKSLLPEIILSHCPLGFFIFSKIRPYVLRAISSYSLFPVAILNCPNAIAAKV